MPVTQLWRPISACDALCPALLEHGIVPVTSDCHYLFPAKVVSRLVKWVTIAHEDYMVGVCGGRGGQGQATVAVLGTADPSLLSAAPPPEGWGSLTRGANSSPSPFLVTSRSCISPKTLWRRDWPGTPISTTWHLWRGAQVTTLPTVVLGEGSR